jgi:hypothetical protein
MRYSRRTEGLGGTREKAGLALLLECAGCGRPKHFEYAGTGCVTGRTPMNETIQAILGDFARRRAWGEILVTLRDGVIVVVQKSETLKKETPNEHRNR